MKPNKIYQAEQEVGKYAEDTFRVSQRELDLCHQISEDSDCTSSLEDRVGVNKKNWFDKEKMERLKTRHIM